MRIAFGDGFSWDTIRGGPRVGYQIRAPGIRCKVRTVTPRFLLAPEAGEGHSIREDCDVET